jgi:formylglycine-generating enzyme required for sulfatase activity
MATATDLLELIGQAVLPALADPTAPLPLDRVARDAWPGLTRLEGGGAPLAALAALVADQIIGWAAVADAVQRLLPGHAGDPTPALTRYLASLPFLLGGPALAHADDLRRRLPPRVPMFQPGDRPRGVGDRVLRAPVRVAADGEWWLAGHPDLPALPPVLLRFLPDLAARKAVPAELALHDRLWMRGGHPSLLLLQHSFSDADPPCLQYGDSLPALTQAGAPPTTLARPPELPLIRRTRLLADLAAALAWLHALDPPCLTGPLDAENVLVEQAGDTVRVRLRLPVLTQQGSPADDVAALARLGQPYFASLTGADAVVALLAAPPRTAAELAEKLAALAGSPAKKDPGEPPVPRKETAEPALPRPQRSRRGAEVLRVLDDLQKGPPEQPKVLANSLGMRFVLVPAGNFVMGSPPTEAGRRDNEGPPHEVIFSKTLYLAVNLVTQQDYRKVMGANPARFQGAAGGGPDHPIEMVSWDDAVAFCRKLSELPAEQDAGRAYRLPTEAEWEYACRAGTATPFHFGAALSSTQANIDGTYPYGDVPRGPASSRTTPVGNFPANNFGLCDMHGNVWEWCADWFDAGYYARSPRQDPPGPPEGTFRVLRGGSWRNHAATCRSAYRNALAPNQRQPFIGFRVVLSVTPGAHATGLAVRPEAS